MLFWLIIFIFKKYIKLSNALTNPKILALLACLRLIYNHTILSQFPRFEFLIRTSHHSTRFFSLRNF